MFQFFIKAVDKKAGDFVLYADKVKVNKLVRFIFLETTFVCGIKYSKFELKGAHSNVCTKICK